MKWIKSLLSSKRGNSLIASDTDTDTDTDTDVGEEIEPAETQPQKRQRIIDEQRLVLYGEEGSSSNSKLTSQLVTLYNNPAEYQRIVILVEKLKHLSARQRDVITELENAEIQPGKKRREVVQHWLTDVQRIKQKIQTKIKDGQGSTSNSNPSHDIENLIKEVDELIQRGKFPDGLVLSDHRNTRYALSMDKKPVGISFQENTGKILGWLRDHHEHCIIGVYGMGGVGKTTLLQHIHDQLLQDSDYAGDVCWVTVSQKCSVRKLQEDIARAALGSDLQEQDEKKRAGLLHSRLAARGPTILILDDMWEQVVMSEVGIPLGNSNCKIILSSRLYDVCRKMGCKNFVIKVENLHEGEAWDLFVEKLEHYDKLEEKAKNIAWDIAKECGGLPLAIATMARSLTDVVDIDEWITALNDLKSARDQVDMEKGVYRVLRYSYERLNDKRVQNCFLSCILYHEDEKIKKTTLIDLWIVEGLLDDIGSRDFKVSKGNSILSKLENSCLLESCLNYDEEKCVKMHDMIRDMAIIITKEHPLFIADAGRQLKHMPEEKWSEDLVKVSLSDNDIEEIPSGMASMTPNLTVLMLNGNPLKVIPDSFFEHMRALTVLDLSETLIVRVPERVSDLENLRGLMLAHCENLEYVPSVAKLTKLRALCLEGCSKLKEAPRGLERLKRVEKASFIRWDVSDVIGFNEVIRSWTSLTQYRFWICDPALCETFDEWNMFYSSEKVVWIRGGEFGEDKSTCLLPTALELMVIEKCDLKGRCLGDVFQTLGEVEAAGVKFIYAKDCRGLESIAGSSGTQQGSSVEGLGLKELPDLRSIAKLGVPHSFSHLGVMYIFRCPKMKVVLPLTCTNNQVHLPNLKSVEVIYCEELEEIFETSEATLCKPLVVLPKLEKLKLRYLPKLKVIFPMAEQLQLPCLDTIEVESCEELEAIFRPCKALQPGPILSLPNLRVLILLNLPKMKAVFPFAKELHLPNFEESWVACCEEMEEIFETNSAATSLPDISLPKSKGFLIQNLPKLCSIYRGLLLGPSLAIPPPGIRLCPKLKFWEFQGGLTSTEPNLE